MVGRFRVGTSTDYGWTCVTQENTGADRRDPKLFLSLCLALTLGLYLNLGLYLTLDMYLTLGLCPTLGLRLTLGLFLILDMYLALDLCPTLGLCPTLRRPCAYPALVFLRESRFISFNTN